MTDTAHAWEESDSQKFWDQVQEDDQGRLIVAAGDTLSEAIRKRRKRLQINDYVHRDKRVARDMIRYVYVLLDVSRWMRQKDPVLPPGQRINATVQLLEEFVKEFFDQNPLSYLGFVVCMKGEAEVLTQLSSSSKVHKIALQSVTQLAASEGPNAGGEFSLQNGIELAGRSLGHQPRHGSREIVILTAALSTCDPGYIMTDTLPKIQRANIRVSCFALSAEMYICRKLAEVTGGAMGVCLDKAHFREWLQNQTVPPPSDAEKEKECEMVRMGFPTRTSSEYPELVHATREKSILARTAFTCPQCQAKNAELPADCAICGLKLVLSPHLARSFHHLFPVSPFEEAPVIDAERAEITSSAPLTSGSSVVQALPADHELITSSSDDEHFCFACMKPFNEITVDPSSGQDPVSSSTDLLRFRCPDCQNLFCVDCDAFLHEQLHNCPGCLLRT